MRRGVQEMQDHPIVEEELDVIDALACEKLAPESRLRATSRKWDRLFDAIFPVEPKEPKDEPIRHE